MFSNGINVCKIFSYYIYSIKYTLLVSKYIHINGSEKNNTGVPYDAWHRPAASKDVHFYFFK